MGSEMCIRDSRHAAAGADRSSSRLAACLGDASGTHITDHYACQARRAATPRRDTPLWRLARGACR